MLWRGIGAEGRPRQVRLRLLSALLLFHEKETVDDVRENGDAGAGGRETEALVGYVASSPALHNGQSLCVDG